METPTKNKAPISRRTSPGPSRRKTSRAARASPAKITPPRLPSAQPRTRLFRELDRALLNHPLVWIVAPAGYGKTTLVASYMLARRRPTLWYQLDEGDDDVAVYFHYLSLAARRAAPRAPLPAFAPEYFAAPSVFARRYFEQLAARLPRRAVCVFDNYQDVAEEAALHDVLHTAVAHIPAEMNVVVVSRTEPPPQFVVDRANEVMAVIGREALRLTPQESLRICRARLRGVAGVALRRITNDLHERSQGWAAGLVLMLERWNARRELPDELGDDRAQQPVFDYFYRELFAKADEETRHLLLCTCYLPTVGPAGARQLTSNRRAGDILAQLHRGNFFTLQHASAPATYQYHPLLREFLRMHVRRTLDAAEHVDLLRRSAEALEGEARIEDAARLLQSAADWRALSTLIKRHAHAFLADGRHRTVLAWLEQLPSYDDDPWLLFWLGSCRFPFDLAKAREAFENAYAGFAATSDVEGRFLSCASIVEAIVFDASDFALLDRWIAALDELTRRYSVFDSPAIEARVVAAMVVALMYRQPHNSKITRWVERLAAIVGGTADRIARVMLGAHLFVYYLAWRGDLAGAQRMLRIIRPPQGTRLSPIAEVLLEVCIANWCWMNGEPDAAIEAVDAGQRIADEHGIVVWSFRLTCTAADVHFSRGDVERAAPYVERLEQALVPEQTAYFAYFLLYSAWTAALRGNLTAAVAGAREVLARFVEAGAPWPITASHLYLAQSLRLSGDWSKAEEHALQGLEAAATFRGALLHYCALHSLASTHFQAGRVDRGEEYLRAAFALGRKHSYARLAYYFNDATSAADLCAKALDAGIETDYALEMIRERGLLPPSPEVAPDAWPFPVRIYTLHGFGFERNGVRAQLRGKAQHRPLSLLKAVVALGGHAVPEAQIVEALWPDADGDAARRSLTIALHRLRRLLGCDEAIRMQDHQLTLDPRYAWVDAWAFERLLEQAQSDGTVRSRASIERALAYYRAPFLSADAEPWVLSMRELLRGKLLRAIERLGRTLEQQGEWENAARWYERAIETDPLAESFYRRQMICHDALRRPAEALAAYRRCEAVLGSTLGVPPALETQALHRRIRAAGRNR
jgi:LuxR family transcriptional regulator, maltose regulon positive regulatory protein